MGRNWCSVDRWYFEGLDAVAAAAAKICRKNVLFAAFTLCINIYIYIYIYIYVCVYIYKYISNNTHVHVRANVKSGQNLIISNTCSNPCAGAMMMQLQNLLTGSGDAKKCSSPATHWKKTCANLKCPFAILLLFA